MFESNWKYVTTMILNAMGGGKKKTPSLESTCLLKLQISMHKGIEITLR